jgi:hypothetical protein
MTVAKTVNNQRGVNLDLDVKDSKSVIVATRRSEGEANSWH